MGVCYVIAFDAHREYIDPGKIGSADFPGGFTPKRHLLVHGIVMNVAAAWVLDRAIEQRSPIRIVDDMGDDILHVESEYRDVTAEAVEVFNQCGPSTMLRYVAEETD